MIKLKNLLAELNDSPELNEGVYDPAIFKAIFLAGGPGSGKSYVAGKTTGGMGFKIVNSDDAFEHLLKKVNLGTHFDSMPPEEYATAMKQRDRAKQLTASKMDMHVNSRLGIIIDGTGKDYNEIADVHNKLKNEFGYDCYMIFVNTSLDVALKRNKMRARVVPEEVVKDSWTHVQSNMGKFQNLFGASNFVLVDNDNATEDVLSKAWRVIRNLVSKPPQNKIAKDWIAMELQKKRRTESRGDYQVYHNTYSSAVDAALEYAQSKGYELVEDDVWNQISTGPKKPSDGKTNKATISLTKNGKEQRKALHIQIYGMGNRYELNAYIS